MPSAQHRRPDEIRAWPPLAELREAFPREWETVQRDIAQATGNGDVEDLKAYVLAVSAQAPAAERGGRTRAADTTPSVELYVLIASRHEFAAGNWVAYREQQGFTFEEGPELSRLVLPPELEAAVYVFRSA